MDCRKAQILFAPHIMGDSEPGEEQYRQLEIHLLSCQACREGYEIRKQTIAFIEQNKAIFAKALRTPEEKKAAEQEEIERSWKRIEARLDDIEAQERQEKHIQFRRLFVRVSAAAACLAIGIFAWITFSIHSTPKNVPKPISQQVALAPKPSVKIELMSKNGNTIIPANQQIASTDELKILVINGKHRMMMNTNTILTVKPFVESSNIGCVVKLASGQIYTHVQHDGNPFLVDTACGRVVITGTTFDVTATNTSTTLVVSEGTVQFESGEDTVKVAAGQISRIVGQSAPSIPLSCNTAELTAWATGYKPEPLLARVESNTDLLELPLSFGEEPIVLEETDYESWVEQKRDWFEQEFLWIFQLREALAKEGIEADYPELLIKTSDVWQFVCLEVLPARFFVVGPNSLLNVVSNYGFDKQWLLENVPVAKSALEKPVLSENSFTGLKAFGRWLEYLDKTKGLEPPTPIYSFHAGKYLANTRSLIWFAVRDGKYELTDEERAEVLVLLQREVDAANICQENALYQLYKKGQFCGPVVCREDKWYKWADVIAKNIKTITSIEKKIKEYEISK